MVGISGHEPGIARRHDMTAADREAAAARQRAQEIALWRWTLVGPAMDPALTVAAARPGRAGAGRPRARGPVRDGRCRCRGGRSTGGSWRAATGGFEALVPVAAAVPRRGPTRDVLELAAGLKRENPERTAAQVRRILPPGWAGRRRSGRIQRLFDGPELDQPPRRGSRRQAFGRFEADAVERDLDRGPAARPAGRAAARRYLFAYHRRPLPGLMGARFGPPRGRGPAGRRAAPGAGRPRRPARPVYVDYADPPVMPTRAPEPVRRKGRGRHRVGIISGCSG